MRVIAGIAKGRPLVAPRGHRLRPTTDRVKAAIFSMLEADAMKYDASAFPYGNVLDLYAGTGALGIEALSRGSRHADFVEIHRSAHDALEKNLERTGFRPQATIYPLSAESALSILAGPYDLILADPPYSDPSIVDLLDTVGRGSLLSERGLLVLEHSRTLPLPEQTGKLRLDRLRAHGGAAIALFRSCP